MREIWRIIPDNPNYAVSNLGRIKRAIKGKGTRIGKICSPFAIPAGYLVIDMWHEGIRSRLYVHQAVIRAFKGPPPTPKHQVAHDDGIKNRNVPSNLFWKLPVGNAKDKKRHGTQLQGNTHPLSILTEVKVLKMRKLRTTGRTLESLAAEFNTCMQNVDLICRRKTWKHI